MWQKILLGLTMRSYKEVVQQFADAYGLEKSTISEQFVQASRQKLKQLLERSLAGLSIVCLFIDGTIFKGEHLVVAVGLDPAGRKLVLGLRQGATENAAVVGALLGELAERVWTSLCPGYMSSMGAKRFAPPSATTLAMPPSFSVVRCTRSAT